MGLGEFLAAQIKVKNLPFVTVLAGEEFSKLSGDRYTIKPGEAEHYQHLMESLAEQKLPLGILFISGHIKNIREKLIG